MTVHPEFWWYVTRATGITAWIAGLASIVAGLALASRTLGKQPTGPWLLDLHRGCAGVTIIFTTVHVSALVADSYVHFGVADLLVPYASDWKPAAVAGGVVALWLYAAVEATSLARKWIPKRWWRAVHLTSYLAAAASTLHAFTAGTDADHPGFMIVVLVAITCGTFMAAYRSSAPTRSRAAPPAM